MRKIKSKNTNPEKKLRLLLWHRGIRYRINNKKILGKPDIIFLRKRILVFIDGDFWHGFDWGNKKDRIKKNREYWINKIERNIQRDTEINFQLKEQGWTVLRFWENEINKNPETCLQKILIELNKK
jgi:DNA mismatch endonuclease (patch repair protein)